MPFWQAKAAAAESSGTLYAMPPLPRTTRAHIAAHLPDSGSSTPFLHTISLYIPALLLTPALHAGHTLHLLRHMPSSAQLRHPDGDARGHILPCADEELPHLTAITTPDMLPHRHHHQRAHCTRSGGLSIQRAISSEAYTTNGG